MARGALLCVLAWTAACRSVSYSTDFNLADQDCILSWPGDPQGQVFRYALTGPDRDPEKAKVQTFPRNGAVAPAIEPVGSIHVILPPGATHLRGRAKDRLAAFGQTYPRASRHLYYGVGPWFDVDTGDELREGLHELGLAAAAARIIPGEIDASTPFASSSLVVIPLASAGRFAAFEPQERAVAADMRGVVDIVKDHADVVIAVPKDAPEARWKECLRLVEQLDGVRVLLRTTAVRYNDLKDLAAVAQHRTHLAPGSVGGGRP